MDKNSVTRGSTTIEIAHWGGAGITEYLSKAALHSLVASFDHFPFLPALHHAIGFRKRPSGL